MDNSDVLWICLFLMERKYAKTVVPAVIAIVMINSSKNASMYCDF
ncbi:MAG: hypothetical protein ACR2LL_02805 [Nitrosopumilus sp.]